MGVHYAGMGFDYAQGDIVDRPENEALALIKKGYAEPVRGVEIERAVDPPPPQTAVSVQPQSPPPAPVAPAAGKKGKKK